MSPRRTLAAVILAALALAGCTSHTGADEAPTVVVAPSPTSTVLTDECLSAMRDQLREAMNNPDAPEGTRPDECKGVSDAELQRGADLLLAEMFGSDEETP